MLQKSNCKPQDTQDSWSGQPKYRLNSIKNTRFSFAVVFGLLVSLSTGAGKNGIFLLNTLDNVPRLFLGQTGDCVDVVPNYLMGLFWESSFIGEYEVA